MSVKKYFLKESFIFDFDKSAKQTLGLTAVVTFMCALFLLSGIFLDASAEYDRGIAPFSDISVSTPADLVAAVNGFTGLRTITLENDITLALTDIMTVANGAVITIDGDGHTITRTYPAAVAAPGQRHFTVDGTLTLTNLTLCGVTTGIFSMTVNDIRFGGGIDVRSGGTLNLNANSLIQNSTADFGGGVRVRDGATLNITGGEINNNAATTHGGGIYLNGTTATMTMNNGRIADNKVEGRVLIPATPLSQHVLTAIEHGAMFRTWYSNDPSNPLYPYLPAHFDFPSPVGAGILSHGGGGIAARAGASVTLNSAGGTSLVEGNFAERGGGIYITGNGSSLNITGSNVFVRDNSAHHSHHRDASAIGTFDNPTPPASFWQAHGLATPPANWLGALDLPATNHRQVSGSGGGIHVFGAGATFTMSDGTISRNIAIVRTAGMTTGGGGGVSIHSGANFTMTGGTIGGNSIDQANMLNHRPACIPAFVAGEVVGGCTPDCHPNHPNRPAGSGRVDRWANLYPCANGHREGQNRVGADRVGFALSIATGGPTGGATGPGGVAAGALAAPSIASAGAGIKVTNATFTVTDGTIQYNRVQMYPGSSAQGGGVAVITGIGLGGNAAFTAQGSTTIIHNNGAYRGGGVLVMGNSTATLNDDTLIAQNVLSSPGRGGGVAVIGGTFTMNHNTQIVNHTTNNWHPTLSIPQPAVNQRMFANGGGISMDSNAGSVTMNNNALIANNSVSNNGGGATLRANTGAGIFAAPAPAPIASTFTMNDNAQIRGNTAGNSGGGVEITGHGTVFNMNNNAAIGAREDSPTITDALRNTAGNHGGGIFSTGNGVTINMSKGDGLGTTAIRGNHAINNGGGVLIGGTLHITTTPPGPQGATQQPGIEVGRTYPTFNIGATALIADNEARRTGTGAAGGGGGGIYVGNFNNDNSMAGVNLLGGTITRNSTGMIANTNGGGVKVRSQARGANNSIAGLDNHYGFRAVSGLISENVAAPTATAAANGNGGGIFTIRYLHRSPLANNPLFEVPFVSQAQADDYIIRNYSNLNISAETVFAGNNAARDSYPPLGEHLPHIQWDPATGSSVSRAASTHPNNRVYLLNNFDINYLQPPQHDFWFVKEDTTGNPLPGVLFQLDTPTGAAVPGSPAGTPTGTAAGQRISLENGLVGFPLSLSNFGATQNYRLTELEARNADGSINQAVSIPVGHWNFHLLNRLSYVTSITNSNSAEPSFVLTTGNDNAHSTLLDRMMWRIYNIVIQPATFSFFKTDMSIYSTPPNANPPRLTGANFSLYRFTPPGGSASTEFADEVTPAGIAAGYWTQVTASIPHNPAANNIHSFNFVTASQSSYSWVNASGPTIFHLVENEAPSGFDLPKGQWRIVLELDTTTGNAVTPGHDHIRPVLAPSSNAPTFVQPRLSTNDASWYVGNEQPITPTGLLLQNSSTPFLIILGGTVILIAAGFTVRHRKNIEELSKLLTLSTTTQRR